MGSVVVLLVVILISYAIVGAGALAYELTGLDRETARFQALSAFTGVGFTTRVSQRVVGHPARRRITSTLIIVGYGGTASVVASLVASVDQDDTLQTVANLLVIAGSVGLAWLLLRVLGRYMLGDWFRRLLFRRLGADRVPHEELLLYKAGYGITRIEVPIDSAVAGRSLRELELRQLNLQVLATEDHLGVQPIPNPDHVLQPGHHLIVYGELERVQQAFGPRAPEAAPPPRPAPSGPTDR